MSTMPTLTAPAELRDQRDADEDSSPEFGPPAAAGEKLDALTSFRSVTELHKFLEQRSRQWSMSLHLLEEQRQHLRAMEAQRESHYQKLAESMDLVLETARNVNAAADKQHRNSGILKSVFENNRKALDQLEDVAAALSTNFFCWRSAWEQYVRTCEHAEGLRAEMTVSEPLTDL